MKLNNRKGITMIIENKHWSLVALISLLALQLVFSNTAHTQESSTEINVKNAEISAVVRIFSKKTKRNYILDEKVKGKISIFLPGKVTAEEADVILDAVLAMKGFTVVPIGDNLWKIVPRSEAKQTTIPTISKTDGRGSPAMVTRLLNLKYVAADEAKQLVQPLISGDGLINAYTGTNALIIIDSEENVKRLVKIIDSFDIPFTNQEMVIIPVEHADAQGIADKVNEILSDDSQNATSGAQATRAQLRNPIRTNNNNNRQNTTQTTSSLTVSARSKAPKIIADERTNSIILVADEDTTARIRALVSELDNPIDKSGDRFYVYRCQHANAEDLADVLSGFSGNGTSSSSSSSNSSFSGRGFNQNNSTNQSRTPGQARTNSRSTNGTGNGANLGDDISITADPATNSLIITASKADYRRIKELLRELDIKRRQVLVEAVLLEVGVDDTTSLNTEFLSSGGGRDGGLLAINNAGGLTQLFSNPTQLNQFTLAAASAGSLTLPGGITIPTQTLLMQAARNNTNVNVLSSPNILTTDNEEAEIVVGQNVPFLASTASSADNLNNTFNQIDRQDVGITLRITPQISSSDFVTLNMFTEVSNVIASTAGSELGPTTTVRTSNTTVIAKDGQMIVTGGLMSDNITETENGVPYIKDIPLLGHLFRSRSESQQKTNLLIFLTPSIIQDQFDARDETIDRSDKLGKALDDLNLYPRRREVLGNPNVDTVTEGKVYEGTLPGTIFKPSEAEDREQSNLSGQQEPQTRHYKINPSLPEVEAKNYPTKETTKVDQTTAKAMGVLGTNKQERPSKFIVLQADKENTTSADIPFNIDRSSRLALIAVPKNSPQTALSFFKSGERYYYATGKNADKKNKFRVMGVFDKATEARDFYKGLPSSWHGLSPYETMNIGKGPWVKG